MCMDIPKTIIKVTTLSSQQGGEEHKQIHRREERQVNWMQ